MSETEIQNDIMTALAWSPKVVFASVNTCGKVQIKKKWVTLGIVGMPDITGMLRTGQYFGIEVKDAKGKASKEQTEFINDIVKNGGKAGIARSIDDALCIIDKP